jgi:hypothetical protein
MTHDIEQQLATVWAALERLEDLQPEPESDAHVAQLEAEHDDICLAMAVIREALGLPDESEPFDATGEG